MLKSEEIANPDSCLNKAADDEMLFVLRGHDVSAPAAIRAWIADRIHQGKNKFGDEQIRDAIRCVKMIEDCHKKQSIGEKAYEKFCGSLHNRMIPGTPVTMEYWDNLHPDIKEAWEKTARFMFDDGVDAKEASIVKDGEPCGSCRGNGVGPGYLGADACHECHGTGVVDRDDDDLECD